MGSLVSLLLPFSQHSQWLPVLRKPANSRRVPTSARSELLRPRLNGERRQERRAGTKKGGAKEDQRASTGKAKAKKDQRASTGKAKEKEENRNLDRKVRLPAQVVWARQ